MRLALLLCSLAAALPAQTPFYVHDGDTVVFYGDSITDQRLYTTFAETYAVTRFPQLRAHFVHSGWGGDRVRGGGGGPIDVRLRRDVLAYKPTVMTIMLGMNDGRYRAFDPAIFEQYTTGYENMLKTVRAAAPGIRITLIQPSPYDDVTRAPLFEGGYNAVLLRYSNYLSALAEKEHLDVADLNTSVVQALQKANSADPTLALKILPDRVHPGPAGHLLMAEALLKAWNAPAMVTDVELDAQAGKSIRSENTAVDSLTATASGITWTQTDRALPMPVDLADPTVALAIRSSDFIDALDQETLRIDHLAPGTYTLQIDGTEIGSFTAEQLAGGVNLAALRTPMARQAAAVHELTLKRAGIHNTRWRQVQVPLQNDNLPSFAAALKTLDQLDDELYAAQHAAAQPKPHRYELKPRP